VPGSVDPGGGLVKLTDRCRAATGLELSCAQHGHDARANPPSTAHKLHALRLTKQLLFQMNGNDQRQRRRYFALLRRFVGDLAEPILEAEREIYQYAGSTRVAR
jgi:hypothetical protein